MDYNLENAQRAMFLTGRGLLDVAGGPKLHG